MIYVVSGEKTHKAYSLDMFIKRMWTYNIDSAAATLTLLRNGVVYSTCHGVFHGVQHGMHHGEKNKVKAARFLYDIAMGVLENANEAEANAIMAMVGKASLELSGQP
jgi:hypothetical protein